MTRKFLAPRVRFEVFKRDGFCCQYCGSTPPAVVLQVDHIDPVSNGGNDDDMNLITACVACNQGKSAGLLLVLPESVAQRGLRVAEAEAKLLAHREIIQAQTERKDADVWSVVEVLFGREETTERRFLSICQFLSRLELDAVMDAAMIARLKKPCSEMERFRYFCGICWNRIDDVGTELTRRGHEV